MKLQREFQKEQQTYEYQIAKEKQEYEERKHQREVTDRARQVEIERMQVEQKKLEKEMQETMEAGRHSMDEEDNDEIGISNARKIVKGPKMPCFEESKDNMDAFLHRFEIYAGTQGWKKEQWAVYLSALLKGRALEVYSRLPIEDAQDYDTLKDALLKRFNLTEEGFKQKFKTAKSETNEAPAQFITRLKSYLMRWIELANVKKDFEGITNLVIKEQYLETCSLQLAVFLRERKPADLDQLAKLAEQYLEAHANRNTGRKLEQVVEDKCENRSVPPKASPIKKSCFNCGKVGHIAKDCFHRRKTAAMQRSYPNSRNYHIPVFNGRNQNQQRNSNESQRTNTNARMEYDDTETVRKVVDDDRTQSLQSGKPECKRHQREWCTECNNFPVHRCNAAQHLAGTEVELKCGCSVPVIADACRSGTERMPVCEGFVGEQKVSLLRDTGCSTVVIKRCLVNDEQLTGAEEICVLIDGTVRKTPVAEVEINTPYYKGKVRAVCMRNPLYDLIVGNIPGVKMEEEIAETHAVVTRSQAQKEKLEKPIKPLNVSDGVDTNVNRDQLISLQQQDESIKKLLEKTDRQNDDDENPDVQFKLKNGILYRYCKSHGGRRIVSSSSS